MTWDFLGGPVVKTLHFQLPLQGAWVRTLVGELRYHMSQGTAKKTYITHTTKINFIYKKKNKWLFNSNFSINL